MLMAKVSGVAGPKLCPGDSVCHPIPAKRLVRASPYGKRLALLEPGYSTVERFAPAHEIVEATQRHAAVVPILLLGRHEQEFLAIAEGLHRMGRYAERKYPCTRHHDGPFVAQDRDRFA